MHASFLVLLGLGIAAVAGAPSTTASTLTIVGGNLTTIDQYPFQVAVLFEDNLHNYKQGCGGSILNNRSILTAAHCVRDCATSTIRVRVGSSFASSGGVVHKVVKFIVRNQSDIYSFPQPLKDFAIIRLASPISFNKQAKPATLAHANYNLGDNQTVWAAGWGSTESDGPSSEQLRHVKIWTVNQTVCKDHYAGWPYQVTDDMLCAGWLGVGGRDTCQGDSGGPLVHNGVVVGVTSWGNGCALADYPGVYARVSRAYDWIQANA